MQSPQQGPEFHAEGSRLQSSLSDGDGSRVLFDAYVNNSDRRQNIFPTGRHRNRSERRFNARANWLSQIDALADAWLVLRHSHRASGAPEPVLGDDTAPHTPRATFNIPGHVVLVYISSLCTVPMSTLAPGPLNVALLRRGYLGATPVRPTIAFSVRTLQCFVHLRSRARTAKQNFVRMVCDLHNILYNRGLSDRFSEAVDAFNEILRAVDARANAALERTLEWRMKHGCPACGYKCEGEPPLTFARQLMLDGNNSLKRWLTAGGLFDQDYSAEFILPRSLVEECKDEVPRRTAGRSNHPDPSADAAGNSSGTCADKWRNARPESEKANAMDVLDETGVFVCLCGHGFVILASDMWRSGELAKYPLSIVKKLIELFKDEGVLEIGYDIGCAHSTTAANTSFGDAVKRHTRFVVGPFHGHAHNRQCQLRFHPRYVRGSGREDFEGCERLFSVTNFFAGLVRHATSFHRHEDIENAFKLWNKEKYLNIGSLLVTRFQAALSKIEEHEPALAISSCLHGITDMQFEAWIQEELDYLLGESERAPPAQDDAGPAYASALEDWWAACDELDKLDRPFIAYNPAGHDQRADRRWLAVQGRVARSEATLRSFEQRFDFVRWAKDSPEYEAARQGAQLRAFEVALDSLERAIVSRMFELEKANLRATGYKLRRHIANAIARRSAALNSTLQKYNTAASSLQPPRRTFTMQDILEISWLDDFPLLRHDVRDRPWARPDTRRRITAWAETQRAREEIERIRVESVRIRTWVRDEEATWNAKIALLAAADGQRDVLLAHELDLRGALLFDTHTKILADLRELDRLDGLSREREAGLRAGEQPGQPVTHHPTAPSRLPPFVPPLRRGVAEAALGDLDAGMHNDDFHDAEDEDPVLEEDEEHELDSLLQLANLWAVS